MQFLLFDELAASCCDRFFTETTEASAVRLDVNGIGYQTMPAVFSVERRVEFCETDAAGIAHFSAFMCYMEQAEHAFLRHVGTSVVRELGDGWHLSWPRVHAECDFRGAAKFEDQLLVEVQVLKLGEKSLTYGFEFSLNTQSIASGKIVAVCCRVRPGESLESTTIPAELRSRLVPYCR